MLQNILLRSYAIGRRSGLFSSKAGQRLFVEAYYIYKSVLERRQAQIVQRLTDEGSVAVDVGANLGFYTRIMSKAVGSTGSVLAFEPEPFCVQVLRSMTLELPSPCNVTVVSAALGDHNGHVPLYVNSDHPADHRTYHANGHQKRLDAQLLSLDSYLEKMSESRPVSLVKIDVQGAETLVLRGMRQTLLRQRQARIMIEFAPDHLVAAGTNLKDLIALIVDLEFRPFIVQRNKRIVASSWAEVEDHAHREKYIDVLLSRDPMETVVA